MSPKKIFKIFCMTKKNNKRPEAELKEQPQLGKIFTTQKAKSRCVPRI